MKSRYTLWGFIKSLFVVVNKPPMKPKGKNLIKDSFNYLISHFGDDHAKYCFSKKLNHNIFTYLDLIESMEGIQGRYLTSLEIIKIGVRNNLLERTKNIGRSYHKQIDELIDSMFRSKGFKEHTLNY